jgi:uncharacterized membrane protein
MSVQKRIFILLMVFAAMQTFYYYSKLPENLATHYNAAGRPNGWSSKDVFFAMYFGMIGLLALIFYLLPNYLMRLPVSMINLPGKDYWLEPSRREDTVGYIKEQMLQLGNATLAFMILLFQLIIDANMKSSAQISTETMWIILGAYLLFTAVWTTRFIMRFNKRPGG